MPPVAELVLPALHWDPVTGYEGVGTLVDRALALGVGGFVVEGGPEAESRELIKDIRGRSRIPLLIAAGVARGAGQRFGGATGLPPLPAIAALGDSNLVARAAKLTAREVRPIGVNWGFAPCCDVREDALNAVTGLQAIGDDPASVSAVAAAWIEACQHEGMLATASHFPGYGRVAADDREETPVVEVPRSSLFTRELVPFEAAIASRVASMLVAHVAYPTLDASDSPATFSTTMLRYLLRERHGFEGLVATSLLRDRAPLDPLEEADLAVRALDAGCDLLLSPTHLDALIAALEQSVRDGPLYEDRVDQSRRRRLKWAQWAAPQTDYRKVSASDVAWALQLAERVIHPLRGSAPQMGKTIEVIIIDDDASVPALHPRSVLLEALGALDVVARRVDGPSAASRAPVFIALHARLDGERAAFGLHDSTRALLQTAQAAAIASGREATVLLFAPPTIADAVPDTRNLICCWSGDRAMQEATARWLVRGGGAG
jgi:beta-glucosidase